MKIIGRKREKDELMQCLMSKRPEFVVYGSRRVGKNYLVLEFLINTSSYHVWEFTY